MIDKLQAKIESDEEQYGNSTVILEDDNDIFRDLPPLMSVGIDVAYDMW